MLLAGCGGGRLGDTAPAGAAAAGAPHRSRRCRVGLAPAGQEESRRQRGRPQNAGRENDRADAETASPLGDELDRRLVDFINADPPREGEKPSGRLLAALRMKSDEDILLAHHFIEQGGDYRRAIEIYEAALAVDPDNPRLEQELRAPRPAAT